MKNIKLALEQITPRLEEAVKEGDTSRVKNILKNLGPKNRAALIGRISTDCVAHAARSGNVDICTMLLKAATPKRKQEFIQSRVNFDAFRYAAERGHTTVVELLLLEVDPAQKQAMIQASNFYAFRLAAKNGHTAVVESILREADELPKQAMIQYGNFMAFCDAAKNGHKSTVESILRKIDPKLKQPMIQFNGFYPLRLAAEGGHTSIVEIMLREGNQDQKQAMIEIALPISDLDRKTLPLLIAHGDHKQSPESDLIKVSNKNPGMATRVDAYRELLTHGRFTCMAETVNQNALLKLVCKSVTGRLMSLPNAIFTSVCTFLGIPNFPQSLKMKMPECKSLGFDGSLKKREETKKYDNDEKKFDRDGREL